MRLPSYTGPFKRDAKLARKRGDDMGKLRRVIGLLLDGQVTMGSALAPRCASAAQAANN